MATYQWTDWITHVPGQELPPGTHAIFEFYGSRTNGGKPFQEEGTVNTKCRGHGCWHATDPHGSYCMIVRYKLRSIAAEGECELEARRLIREDA